MKRLIILLLSLSTLGALGCSKPVGPEKTALGYYQALAEGDVDAAYKLISVEDRSFKSKEKFSDWMMREGWPLKRFDEVVDGSGLLIRSVHHDQKTGAAVIEYSHPTFYRAYREIRRRNQTVRPAIFHQEVRKVIAREGYQPRRIAKKTHLRYEGSGWRVFLNFEEDEKYRLKLDEAIRLAENGKLEQAQRAFEKIVLWDSHFEDSEIRLGNVKNELTEKKRTEEYIEKYLTLENMEVQQVALGRRRLFGYLVNNGPKTIIECGLGIYFQDDDGRVLGEMTKFPVMESEASSRYAYPLKSGDRTRLNFSLEEEAPEGWDKKLSFKIVILKLS